MLTRPNYRPRPRFPLREVRSTSLWIILAILASRGYVRCTPAPQPTSVIIDCAHDRSGFAQADVTMRQTTERLSR